MNDFADLFNEDGEVVDFYCVSIYKIDKACGGPEEGGWYYTYGDPVLEFGMHTRCFSNHAEAQDYKEALEKTLLVELNKGRRSISSVLSEGVFSAEIDENEYPVSFPKVQPHYE